MTDPSDETGADGETPLTRAEARRSGEGSTAFQEHVRAARDEFEHQIDRARADFEQVNDRINARTGRNLLMATLIGVMVGGAFLASLLFIKWLFLVLAIPVAMLGVFEFARALQTAGRRVDVVPQLAAVIVLAMSGYFFGYWTHWVLTFALVAGLIIWRLVAQMIRADGRRYGEVLDDVLAAGFVTLYVTFLASFTVILLRQDQGQYWLLGMIIAVVAADTGAYAAGLAFGSHPMAPRISPKKTWEGFAGGALAAVGLSVLYAIFVLHTPWWVGAVFGLVILGSATIGDLGESMIKRDLGIKDMSSWLPGHGGVLDRLDSILPSAAAALALYFLFFPLVSA